MGRSNSEAGLPEPPWLAKALPPSVRTVLRPSFRKARQGKPVRHARSALSLCCRAGGRPSDVAPSSGPRPTHDASPTPRPRLMVTRSRGGDAPGRWGVWAPPTRVHTSRGRIATPSARAGRSVARLPDHATPADSRTSDPGVAARTPRGPGAERVGVAQRHGGAGRPKAIAQPRRWSRVPAGSASPVTTRSPPPGTWFGRAHARADFCRTRPNHPQTRRGGAPAPRNGPGAG